MVQSTGMGSDTAVPPKMSGMATTVGPRQGCSQGLFQLRRGSGLKTSSWNAMHLIGLAPRTLCQCFCWSEAVLWAWLDLNQRPHPYQGCALTA